MYSMYSMYIITSYTAYVMNKTWNCVHVLMIGNYMHACIHECILRMCVHVYVYSVTFDIIIIHVYYITIALIVAPTKNKTT